MGAKHREEILGTSGLISRPRERDSASTPMNVSSRRGTKPPELHPEPHGLFYGLELLGGVFEAVPTGPISLAQLDR